MQNGFPVGSSGEESACNAGDLGSVPGLGRSPGVQNGYPLQDSGLENSMDCLVHGVAKSRTWLSDFCFHVYNRELVGSYSFYTWLCVYVNATFSVSIASTVKHILALCDDLKWLGWEGVSRGVGCTCNYH